MPSEESKRCNPCPSVWLSICMLYINSKLVSVLNFIVSKPNGIQLLYNAYYHKTQKNFKFGWYHFYCSLVMSLYYILCKLGHHLCPMDNCSIYYYQYQVIAFLFYGSKLYLFIQYHLTCFCSIVVSLPFCWKYVFKLSWSFWSHLSQQQLVINSR